jgi:16S rRNA (adenine1518-N6/adenine1519-N6)-dimethyltransferase
MHDKLYNPDYLYSLCKNYGLQPSKKYGQNYLVHPEKICKADILAAELNGTNFSPIEKMIEAADIKKTDAVVEVGPGFGVLTFALAGKAKQVVAFEIEKKLMPYWQDRKPENVEIIWGNVLRQGDDLPSGIYKMVANLPYQITSAVMRFFLETENPPESMTLMVQKEVAERICAKAGDMSVLAVSVQYFAEPEIVAIVPRDNFWPVPKVDSAIIKLSLRERPIVIPAIRHLAEGIQSRFIPNEVERIFRKEFFHLVKIGFANRRKLLIKNLELFVGKKHREMLKSAFAGLGLSENARAQELSVKQWVELLNAIGMQEITSGVRQ